MPGGSIEIYFSATNCVCTGLGGELVVARGRGLGARALLRERGVGGRGGLARGLRWGER